MCAQGAPAVQFHTAAREVGFEKVSLACTIAAIGHVGYNLN
jgi:hypothetical protein